MSASVRADGTQLMPGGAEAVSRGGATAARPTDANTLLANPGALVDVQDNQFTFGLDTGFNSVCVKPYGYYGWGVYLPTDQAGNVTSPDAHRSQFGDPASTQYSARHLDQVCNSGSVGPLPQLAFVLHPMPKLAVGFGFVAPVFVGGAQWGGQNGTIATDDGARPTPTRYELIRQETKFALNPTIGGAYQILPWLAVGVTLQVTMASLDTYQMMALRAGTSPSNDMLAKLHASDYFMPALTFGVYAKPTDRLRFGGTFAWSDGFDGSGDLTLTTNVYHQGAVGTETLPLQNDPVKLRRVRVEIPWTATLAARYAQPRYTSDADSKDLLKRELWDVEIDANFTANRAADQTTLQIQNEFTLEFRRADGTPQMPLNVTQKDLQQLSSDNHLENVIALRAGGSFNAIPGLLQLSAGGFFQSRGVDPAYASVASYGLMRIGFGLGALVRLGKVDLMASYAHIFQEEISVAPPTPQPRTAATDDPRSGFDERIYENGQLSAKQHTDPAAPSPSSATAVASLQQSAVLESSDLRQRVINAGLYTASFDVLSVGLNYHF
jgi:hypothetical protein